MAKKKPASTDKPAAPVFEESLETLEHCVQRLEEGQLGLTESLACYEEGVRHLKSCYEALEAAERKIELLAGIDAEGNPVTEPFDDDELTLDEKAAARGQRRSRKTTVKERPNKDSVDDRQGGLF